MKVKEMFNKAMNFADDHQREILVGLEIAGIVGTAVLSWRAGIKADKIIKEQKAKMNELEEQFVDEAATMTEEEYKAAKKDITIETIKELAPVVAPTVVTGGMTLICAVGGYNASTKRIAALTAAYNLAKDNLSDFKEKAAELYGDKKAQQISDGVKTDKVKNTPPDKSKTVLATGKGQTLCMDDMSGRYFYSDPEEIRKACNLINKRMMDEYYISLNELYDELGLPEITLGDDVGFNIDDGLIDIEHLFTAALYNDTPILVMNYDVSPKYMEHRGAMFR